MPQVRIRAGALEEILMHARSEPQTECCGLLAGTGGAITTVLRAENSLASPTAYEIAPQELFRLFRCMRSQGLEHLGIYHSHPSGENAPSPRDIEQANYPEQSYFIISPGSGVARAVRAFSIRDGCVQELSIEIMAR